MRLSFLLGLALLLGSASAAPTLVFGTCGNMCDANTCVGDCDGDGEVRINEVILGVNIALGNADVSACPSLQCIQNVSGVFVNCLIMAVNNVLFGCAGPLPTPIATPTPIPPQCSGVACDGSCAICPPCTPGTVCPAAPCRLGSCQPDASDLCQCVPIQTAPSTPTATPTPAAPCRNVPCTGLCAIFPPCTPGPNTACPDYVLKGSCQVDAAGDCQCVPFQPATPSPTAIPDRCDSAACDGLCIIRFCPPQTPCPNLLGHCELGAAGSCDCVPGGGNPTPTPTPCAHCLPHGRTCCECPDQGPACFDFAWVEVTRTCPVGCKTFLDAACDQSNCHPGPVGGPSTCVPLQPCTTDQECDDGNGCTADQCTPDGCTHGCVCD